MTETTNACIEGTRDHLGKSIIYNDTDSEIGSTIHHTNYGDLSVEELFLMGTTFWGDGKGKEYSHQPDLKVLSYDPETDSAYYGFTNYIYRHKVSKAQWEIEDEDGNTVRITGDHSIMVERNGVLTEIKPKDMLLTDVLITVSDE